MNKKIHKILGVGLTLVMALSLTFALSAPAMADEEEWSLFSVPTASVAGALNDGFMSALIATPGPIARAIDGTLYLYVAGAAPFVDLFSSDDNGRTWSATDFKTDFPAATAIVDMAPSPEDADVLYVVTALNVYKTEDAGDSWEDLGVPRLANGAGAGTQANTCIAVGYANGDPHLFVGTVDAGATDGEVYYYQDSPFASTWTDLEVGAASVGATDASDVFSIAVSPDFSNDTTVVAVINEVAAGAAFVVTNQGASIGVADWDDVALTNEAGAALGLITNATDPVFVDDFDFDDNYELFVGIDGPVHTVSGLGGVYRLTGTGATDDFLLDDVDDNVVSLDATGDLGNVSLLAGTRAAGIASVWYSTDDGESFDETDTPPTGVGATSNLVVMLDDFADSGEALCVSSAATKESGVHMTTDFGATWQGISMLDTDMGGGVLDISFTADYGEGDAPMFMITASSVAATDLSVWRYDGTNWERMLYDGANALDLVEVSPSFADDNTLFIADSSAPTILRSSDGGASFSALTRQPGAPIAAWVVIDDETVITSDDGSVTAGDIYKTTRYGRRAWDTITTGGGIITDIAVSPNYASDGTIIAGDAASLVFISTDEGENWDELGDGDIAVDATAAGNTYVAFDSRYADNMLVYAASDDVVQRCEVDPDEDPGDLSWTNLAGGLALTTGAANGVSGIVVSDDGIQVGVHEATLYVLDATVTAATPTGGLWRCLNPAADTADIVFENTIAGLTAAAEDFSPVAGAAAVTVDRNLHLTSGSNILFAIDSTADVVWTYEDTLAAPVVLVSPGSGEGLDSTDTVNFEWEALNEDTAVQWEIQVNEEEDFPGATDELVGTLVGGTEHDSTTLTWRAATAGTEYFWRVRVASGTGPLMCCWSE